MDTFMYDTQYGKVECVLYGTEGPIIVGIHSTTGGIGQIKPYLADLMDKYECRVLAWSRPGFGKTSSSLGRTFSEQALIMNSILGMFKENRFIVYAIGGGSGVAYHFAANHVSKCSGLIIESGVSRAKKIIHKNVLEKFVESASIRKLKAKLKRLHARWFPGSAVKMLLSHSGYLSRGDLETAVNHVLSYKLELFNEIITALTESDCAEGIINDIINMNSDYPLHSISCPTLVIHGSRDSCIDVSHADFLASNIENSTLLEVFKGTHVLPLTNNTRMITTKTIGFVEECTHEK